jgi:hypothetical protein
MADRRRDPSDQDSADGRARSTHQSSSIICPGVGHRFGFEIRLDKLHTTVVAMRSEVIRLSPPATLSSSVRSSEPRGPEDERSDRRSVCASSVERLKSRLAGLSFAPVIPSRPEDRERRDTAVGRAAAATLRRRAPAALDLRGRRSSLVRALFLQLAHWIEIARR